MRRLWSVLLCLCLLVSLFPALPAAAAESLEQQIAQFMEENDLSAENFSLRFYTESGEGYAFNDRQMLPAGQLWMLPLHMYFCEQESMGAFLPENEWSEEEFTIGGLTLKECRYESLLLGRETVALSMRDYLGGLSSYKLAVNEAFGHLEESSLGSDYLQGNCFSAEFWMNCFLELTDRPGIYDDLSRNYSMLQTADALAGYSHSYRIFQIRGEEEGWVTALAKVWAPTPYLLVCSIRAGEASDRLLGELNDLVCDYAEAQADTAEESAPPTTAPRDLSITGGNTDHSRDMLLWIGIAVGAALGIAAVIALPLWLLRRRKDEIYDD